jgi:hypothetical protein
MIMAPSLEQLHLKEDDRVWVAELPLPQLTVKRSFGNEIIHRQLASYETGVPGGSPAELAI